jgi:hypothetical protein
MKIMTWLLTLAVTLWPTGYHGFNTNAAYGAETGTNSWGVADGASTNNGSASGSATNTSSTGSKTCTDNRTTYQGHTDNNCYAYDTSASQDNQRNTQNNNKDMNDKSSQQSSMMGMMAIMAGMAMMAAGAAMMANPPTMPAGMALMAAGAMLLAAGMAAMAAAKEMKDNANRSGVNGVNMDNLPTSTISGDPTKNLGDSKGGKATGSSLTIDPSVVEPGGKSDALVEDFENKTGISRGELIDGLNNGKSPIDMLAASSAMKKAGVGADKIGSLVADAQSSGNMPNGGELLDKIGMSAEDIAAMAAKNASMGGDGALAAGGGGSAGRSPTSTSAPDYSFQGAGKDGPVGSAGLGAGANFSGTPGSGHLSDSVQNALDRSGITTRSLFQMVHEQYKKKMPMMFGAQERKAASHSDNPFADLSKDKVEL